MDDFVTNDEVLCLAKADDIELLLNKNRLRWLGHVARMPETRAVKALLYGELAEGKRKVGRPMLRFKDTIKDVFKRGEVLDSWTECVDNRPEWSKLTHEVCNGIDEKRRVNNERIRTDEGEETPKKIGKIHGSLLEFFRCVFWTFFVVLCYTRIGSWAYIYLYKFKLNIAIKLKLRPLAGRKLAVIIKSGC